MNNFYDFIDADIKEKKALLSVLPTNTPTRKQQYVDTLNDILNKYNASKTEVSNYILEEEKKLLPVKPVIDTSVEDQEIEKLDKLLILGNPLTSYFERLEFDILLYDLMKYYDNTLTYINDTLFKYLEKFKLIKYEVKLKEFNLNPYLYIYMSYFYKLYYNSDNTITEKTFENIYWKCPKVFEYLIIVLRRLTIKCEKKFTKYANLQYNTLIQQYGFEDYTQVINKLKNLKSQILNKNDETEYDIVNKCISGDLDVNNLYSEIQDDFNYFSINNIELKETEKINVLYTSIINLRYNFEEYNLYLNQKTIVNDFKNKYKDFLNEEEKKKKTDPFKEKNKELVKLEKELYKYQIKKTYNSLEELNLETNIKDKLYFQGKALETLYEEYKNYNDMYYKESIRKYIKNNTSVGTAFDLLVAFPFFTKKIIKKLFDLTDEKDIDDKYKELMDIAYFPYRKIIDLIPIFSDDKVLQMLANAYRFDNLDITEDSFLEENIAILFERYDTIIRNLKTQKFKLTKEQIEFLIKVHDLRVSEKI